jgi:hypothetical protein
LKPSPGFNIIPSSSRLAKRQPKKICYISMVLSLVCVRVKIYMYFLPGIASAEQTFLLEEAVEKPWRTCPRRLLGMSIDLNMFVLHAQIKSFPSNIARRI